MDWTFEQEFECRKCGKWFPMSELQHAGSNPYTNYCSKCGSVVELTPMFLLLGTILLGLGLMTILSHLFKL